MKRDTLPEIVPMRRRHLCKIVVSKKKYSSSSSGNNSFILKYWVEACKGNAGDCNNLGINKVSIVGTDMDVMSSYSMKKDFDPFRGKYGLWMNLCISRVIVPCEDTWPLEKIMIFHEVDFRQNKYEFYLDMWDTPRVWRDEVLLVIKEVNVGNMEQL